MRKLGRNRRKQKFCKILRQKKQPRCPEESCREIVIKNPTCNQTRWFCQRDYGANLRKSLVIKDNWLQWRNLKLIRKVRIKQNWWKQARRYVPITSATRLSSRSDPLSSICATTVRWSPDTDVPFASTHLLTDSR